MLGHNLKVHTASTYLLELKSVSAAIHIRRPRKNIVIFFNEIIVCNQIKGKTMYLQTFKKVKHYVLLFKLDVFYLKILPLKMLRYV